MKAPRRLGFLTALLLAIGGALTTAAPAAACPADSVRGDTPQDARDHVCGTWDAAVGRGFNPGTPLNETHPWAHGYVRDFDGGFYGRGGIMERHGEGWASIVGGTFWQTYLAVGGAPGPLGYPEGPHVFGGHVNNGPRENQYMTFEGGVINKWAGGTFATWGEILSKWESLGNVAGPVGRPLSNEAPTARVPGRFSRFEGGNIYYNQRLNEAYHVYGGVLNKYVDLGFSNHSLGLPTSDRRTNPGRGNEFQTFDGGVINQYGGNAYETHGAILDKWNALGGANGSVGLPVSDEAATARVPGRFSRFEGGNIYFNQRINEPHHVYGGILNKYVDLGFSNHPLGLPTSDRQPGARGGDHVYQVFDGGVINQHGGNAYETHGAILDKWNALGGSTGPLGLPTSDEGQTARVDGRYATFQGGNLYFNPRLNGTFHVFGGILNKYAQLGYSSHPLGLPVGDRQPGAAGGDHAYQVFEGGVVNQYGGNAYETHGAILDRWNRGGGPRGALGLPTSDEQWTSRSPQGTTGRYQRFQKGVINFHPKLNKAFVLFGSIGQKYAEAGYASSYLGLPTGEEFSFEGGKRQNFEGGYIVFKGGQAKTDRELAAGGTGGSGGKDTYTIRSLGDSYTAGFGIGLPIAVGVQCVADAALPSTRCDRIDRSWADHTARYLSSHALKDKRVNYANLAVSGSTPHDWLTGGDGRGDVKDFQQRLDGVIRSQPDLIMLSLGGNDLLQSGPECLRDAQCVTHTLAFTKQYMTSLLRRLMTRTQARIYVLLYPYNRGEYVGGIDKLNTALRHAIKATGNRVKYVDPPSFAGHDCGDSAKGSWRLGWDLNIDLFSRICIHANAAGNRALAIKAIEAIDRFGY